MSTQVTPAVAVTDTSRELSPGFQALVGRMLADVEFRRAVALDPARAVREAGLELTAAEVERLLALPAEQRQQIADAVDPRDSKGWWIVILGWFHWW